MKDSKIKPVIGLGSQVFYYLLVLDGRSIQGYEKNSQYKYKSFFRLETYEPVFSIECKNRGFVTGLDTGDGYDVSVIIRNREKFFLDWKVPFWEPGTGQVPNSSWISLSPVDVTPELFCEIKERIVKDHGTYWLGN